MAALSAVEAFPHLAAVAGAALRAWPDHEKFIRASLTSANPEFLTRLENVATDVVALTGDDLDTFAGDYRWMCEIFREEQFYFRRHKRYRRSTIEEAIRDVYGNPPYMARYVNGILLTQVLWQNHAQAIHIYRDKFLPGNRAGYEHLEVGPGHGLFLVSAARDPRCAGLTVWDVSRSSLESTRRALGKMKIVRPVAMKEAEVCSVDPEPDAFDSVTCSEVLEHTEHPHRALANIFRALRPGGRLFLNIPVNSPAPDHIYLWRNPAEVRSMVEDQGFMIQEFVTLPPTGQTLQDALRHDFDISCVTIASKP